MARYYSAFGEDLSGENLMIVICMKYGFIAARHHVIFIGLEVVLELRISRKKSQHYSEYSSAINYSFCFKYRNAPDV